MQITEKITKEIEDICLKFLWSYKTPKISKKQLRFPKDNRGLNFWNLKCKIHSAKALWIVEIFKKDKINKNLISTLNAWKKAYRKAVDIDIPLWDSKVNHAPFIKMMAKSNLMADIQEAWAKIIRRDPALQKGEWITYSNKEEKGMLAKNKVYKAICLTTNA